MKIAFLSETQYQGKWPTNFPNARTEVAWQIALNADHIPITNFESVQDYDWVMLILPKGGTNLNSEGVRLTNNPNRFAYLYSQNIVSNLKKKNKRVAYIQEGPCWYVNDFSVLDQFNFYNQLAECDAIFTHNRRDMAWYKGLFPYVNITTIPTLMIEDLIRNIIPQPEEKTIIGGNFCFLPDTNVLMASGEYKKIQDISLTDNVSIQGNSHRVTHLFKHEIKEEIIEIKTVGNRSIRCTENHKINGILRNKYTWSNGKRQHPITRATIAGAEIEEIFAKDLHKGDFLFIPKFTHSKSPSYCDDLMRLFGWWIAEGNIEKRPDRKSKLGRISFSIHKDEDILANEIKRIVKTNFGITQFSDRLNKGTKSRIIRFSCRELRDLLHKNFGNGALNKNIPVEFFYQTNTLKMIEALFDGDGTFYKTADNSRQYTFCTGSKKLGDSISIILDGYGIRHSKTFSKSKLSNTIFTKISVFNSSDIKKIGGYKIDQITSTDRCSQYLHAKGVLVPIKSIKKIPYNGNVYNIEVEKLHKYITDGILVNNCRWYGGFQSYLVASEFNSPIYIPSSHASQPGEESVPNLSILPRLNWHEWMLNLSKFKYAVHLMPTIAAGTFNLNCAYFGIPCIGNENVDTQVYCFPSLSVDPEDIDAAADRAQRLKMFPDFWKECSDQAKLNYKKYYSIDSWKTKIYSFLEENL